MPSLENGTYQRDLDCPETGDLVIAQKFSKVLEAWSLRSKRAGEKLSYTWVSERQEQRREKYGGVAELHYHILVNQKIKNDANQVIRPEILHTLQYQWCDHLRIPFANNCVDVRPLPGWVKAIPPYMAKYLGKGARLPIRGRRFGASRDLTEFKPIHLVDMPKNIDLEGVTNYTTADGYDITAYYFNTRDTLEQFGATMRQERLYAADYSKVHFTDAAIITRAIKRQQFPQGINIHRQAPTAGRGFIQPDLIPTDKPKKSSEKPQRTRKKSQRTR